MKILSISSILPIPGIITKNDFVFQTYSNYRNLYADDQIVIIRPIKYNLNPFSILRRTTYLTKLKKKYTLNIHDFTVEIFPFFSTWRLRNIHSLVTRSINYINRKRINSLFSRYSFNLIHAQYIFPDGLLAYSLHKKYNIPYFITTHNERFYFNHLMSRKLALKILSNSCDVLPINYSNYLYYRSIGINNIEFIPLGFDKSFLREQRGIFNARISIFTVAELIKLKNIDKVIKAIRMLVPKYNILYTIIGKGTEKESLRKLVGSLNINENVCFIDSIPHDVIADEMYKHDIFIMPSFFETFGRVYFEVMAMGIPVICAKHSGISGFFKEMEEGISVDYHNIEEIADALEFLIANPSERLKIGKNGQRLVENYTWHHVAKELHSKYNNIISTESIKQS